AQRFVESPLGAVPGGQRLYKTGDLARYLPDGNIEFLGRLDHQVKIRGFRIEVGEIETLLLQHPAIQEAVVLAREDQPGNPRLVAYLVPNTDPAPSVSDLRRHLQEKLPDYMLPAAVVMLAALPLTPNGKVDRQALPAPDSDRPDLAAAFAPPRTPTEALLVGIWEEALRLERIGIHDGFFELGGHSLLATQVVSRAREGLGCEIPLRWIFEAPTIATLAEKIAAE